ncbi:MAG: putative ATP-grasp superfamily ATP-dependent carboligase, partial [Hyphomicrobiaceae bacterium]
SAGIEVIVASAKPGPAAASRFTSFLQTPNLYDNAPAWAEAMRAFGQEQDIPPVLIATEDAGLLVLDRYHDMLGAYFMRPHPSPGVVTEILDKRQLYLHAERLGIGVPKNRELTSADGLDGLDPTGVLIKPSCRYYLDDKGRIRSFRLETGATKAIGGSPAAAARIVLGAGFPALLQEAIPGGFENLVTIALSLSRDGRVMDHMTSCKEYEYPEPFGDGLIVRARHDPGLLQSTVELLKSFGYWGICDVEFKFDPKTKTYKVLDANPRPWLWLNLATRQGKSLLLHAYNQTTGLRVRRPRQVEKPTEWVSPRGSMAFLGRCYSPSRHGALLPARLIAGSLSTSYGNWRSFRDPLYLAPSSWRRLASHYLRGPR